MKKYFFTLAMLILTLNGCASNQQQNITNSQSSNEQPITAAQTIDTQALQKVDQLFTLSPTENDAKQRAIQKCMAQKGFTYIAQPMSSSSIRNQVSPQPLTLEDARSYGYQKPSTASKAEANAQSQAEAPGFDTAYGGTEDSKLISVEGIPGGVREDGCLAAAYQELFGSAETGVFFEGGTLNLALPYLNAARFDPAQEELDKKWSECIKTDYSLDYQTPDLASISIGADAQKIATADAQCREKVNYEQVLQNSLNAYLTTFLNDNQNIIQQLSDAKKTATENAPKILQ